MDGPVGPDLSHPDSLIRITSTVLKFRCPKITAKAKKIDFTRSFRTVGTHPTTQTVLKTVSHHNMYLVLLLDLWCRIYYFLIEECIIAISCMSLIHGMANPLMTHDGSYIYLHRQTPAEIIFINLSTLVKRMSRTRQSPLQPRSTLLRFISF